LGIAALDYSNLKGRPIQIDPFRYAIPANADIEFMSWEILKQLSKDGMARVHGHPPELSERYHHEGKERIQIEKRTIESNNNNNQMVKPVHSKLTGQ
jgi:hypothetical protein